MTVKIHKILKSDLSYVSQSVSTIANTVGMTISHYAGSNKSTEATISYTIEGVDKAIPQIDNAEFCQVIRKKIDFTAIGINEEVIEEVGEDIGKYDYKDIVPKRPPDLPSGFQEAYKG